MAETLITDIRDYLDGEEPSEGPDDPGRRLAEHLGRIALAATAWYVDTPLESVLRCRRPEQRPCFGRLRLDRTASGEINWGCTRCDDQGVIRGWQGTPWDLSAADEAADFVTVIAPEIHGELADLAELADLPRLARRVVVRAAIEEGGVMLIGTAAELDALERAVEQAHGEAGGQRRTRLKQLLDKLAVADAEPADDEDPPQLSDKISETLLSFAQPLLEAVGEVPTPVIKNVLTLAVMVWNALVLEAWGRGDDFLDQSREQIAAGLPRFLPLFETLVDRKKRYFGADLRAIGEFEVTREADGELRVTADAWMPETLRTTN